MPPENWSRSPTGLRPRAQGHHGGAINGPSRGPFAPTRAGTPQSSVPVWYRAFIASTSAAEVLHPKVETLFPLLRKWHQVANKKPGAWPGGEKWPAHSASMGASAAGLQCCQPPACTVPRYEEGFFIRCPGSLFGKLRLEPPDHLGRGLKVALAPRPKRGALGVCHRAGVVEATSLHFLFQPGGQLCNAGWLGAPDHAPPRTMPMRPATMAPAVRSTRKSTPSLLKGRCTW